MRREERRAYRKEKRRRNGGIVLNMMIVLIPVVAVSTVLFMKVFIVRDVSVTGSTVYSDEEIESIVLSDDYSWSSLYTTVKCFLTDEYDVDFIDDISVRLKSPTSIEIAVTESEIAGCINSKTLGKNVYFDSDGTVQAVSEKDVEGAIPVRGISVSSASTGSDLVLDDSSSVPALLELICLLDKYDSEPKEIRMDGSEFLVVYDSVQVDLGDSTYLSEKVERMTTIMPMLADSGKGTLHLDTWTYDSTDAYFKAGQWQDSEIYVSMEKA